MPQKTITFKASKRKSGASPLDVKGGMSKSPQFDCISSALKYNTNCIVSQHISLKPAVKRSARLAAKAEVIQVGAKNTKRKPKTKKRVKVRDTSFEKRGTTPPRTPAKPKSPTLKE